MAPPILVPDVSLNIAFEQVDVEDLVQGHGEGEGAPHIDRVVFLRPQDAVHAHDVGHPGAEGDHLVGVGAPPDKRQCYGMAAHEVVTTGDYFLEEREQKKGII